MEEDVFEYKRSEWLKQTKQIIRSNKLKGVVNNKETDQQFLQDIFKIHELQKINQKSIWEEKAFEYTPKQYDQINQKCLLHSEANKFNKTSTKEHSHLSEEIRCECGCMRGKGEDISMFSNEENLTFLGPGVVLFFLYQKRIIYLLILTALIYGTFSLATNYNEADFDESNICTSDDGAFLHKYCEFRSVFSVENKKENSWSLYLQIWLGMVACILWIFGLRMIRVLGYQKNEMIDEMLDSSSDYCISLEKLPFRNFNQKEIEMFLIDLWDRNQSQRKTRSNLNIKSIQIIYNMSEVREMIKQLQEEIFAIRSCLLTQEQQKEKSRIQKLNTEENFLEEGNQATKKIQVKGSQIMNIMVRRSHKKRKRSNSNNVVSPRVFKTSQFAGLSPIKPHQDFFICREKVNQYLKSKEKILSLYEKLKSFRWNFLKNSEFRKNLSTESCLVEFIDSDQQSQFLQQFGSERIPPARAIKQAIMGLIGSENKSGLLFKDNLIKIKRAPEPSDIEWLNCEKRDDVSKTLTVWTITLLIVFISFWMLILIRVVRKAWTPLNNITIIVAISLQIFNRLIWITVVKIVGIEEKNTKTDSIISIMTKATFAQAVNVIFLPLLMKSFMEDQYSGPNGLVGMVVDYQITVFFMMAVWNLLDLPYQTRRLLLFFKCTRNYIIRMLSQSVDGSLKDYDQIRKVLTYYEPPEFPIAGGYVYVITVLNQAFFFCHLQPLLLLLLVLNMGTFLVINKYLLYKRCKLPALTDIMVFQTCISLTKNVPFMYGIGSLYFIVYSGEGLDQCIPSILCILFTVIVMLNPNKIFSRFTSYLVDILAEEEISTTHSEVVKVNVESETLPKAQNVDFQESSGCHLNKDLLKNNLAPVFEGNSNSEDSNTKLKTQNLLKIQSTIVTRPKLPLTVLEESNLQDEQSDNGGSNKRDSSHRNQEGERSGIPQNMLDISNIDKQSDAVNSSLNDNSFIKKIMKKSFGDQEQSTRKQCYCQNSNLNLLFYFEKFFSAQGSSVSGNRSKSFCESFAFDGNSKRISLFQLLPFTINDQIDKAHAVQKEVEEKSSQEKV